MEVQNILIVGGYGVVGGQIAKLVRKHYPDVTILLGGRNSQKGQALAQKLGNSKAVHIDISNADPLATLTDKIDIVLTAVNDINDNMLLSAIRHNVALVDITRWTQWMRSARALAESMDTSKAPVVFASSWMAATIGIITKNIAAKFETVNNININILYATKDKSGPNSVEYMDRLAEPFEVTKDGKKTMARAFRRAVPIELPGVGKYKFYHFDTPDQYTLPAITNAQTVTTRIGFDDKSSGPLLSFLIRSGIWKLISGDRFTNIRRSLLHNPGEGAPHCVRLDIDGETAGGALQTESWLVTDPQGQTHLTAVGALIQLGRILTDYKTGVRCVGLQIAEAVTDPNYAMAIMRGEGVLIKKLG